MTFAITMLELLTRQYRKKSSTYLQFNILQSSYCKSHTALSGLLGVPKACAMRPMSQEWSCQWLIGRKRKIWKGRDFFVYRTQEP